MSANDTARRLHARAEARIENRRASHFKTALAVYVWVTYPADNVGSTEVPDELWDPSNPEKSMEDIVTAVDTAAAGEGAREQVNPLKVVKQVGSDWVAVSEFGRLEGLTVVGPSAAKTTQEIVDKYMVSYEYEGTSINISLADFV